MGNIFTWIKLALPFLTLAYDAALLINPSLAAELKIAIDALGRAADTPIPGSPVARGFAAIQAFGKNVLAALESLKSSDLSAEEKSGQAADLVATLSDPTKVYQAKKGDDAALLAKLKLDAQAFADTINS